MSDIHYELLLPISLNTYPKELNSKHEKKIAHLNNTGKKKNNKDIKNTNNKFVSSDEENNITKNNKKLNQNCNNKK